MIFFLYMWVPSFQVRMGMHELGVDLSILRQKDQISVIDLDWLDGAVDDSNRFLRVVLIYV